MANYTGQVMQDLSKGALPIMVVVGMIGTVFGAGFWLAGQTTRQDTTSANLSNQVARLEAQVNAMSLQLGQISVSVAKGPVLPDNVAFKADLLKFCVENRALKCPQF